MRLIVMMGRFSPWSQEIALALQEQGHEIHVFDFKTRGENTLASPTVPGILADYERFASRGFGMHLVEGRPVSPARYAWAAARLRSVARHVSADLVLTLYGGAFALTAYASRLRPYCVYVVGSDVLYATGIRRRLNRWTLSSAAKVFANGDYLASQTSDQAPSANVMSLLIGVDVTAFPQAVPQAGPVQFVCSRGFQRVYNNEAIIRAIARVPSDAPSFHVVFTSGGELLDECRMLADRVIPSSLRDRVSFLGGVSHERLRQEVHRSHAMLSLSRSDGTATSVLEGMAAGLYPILSDIPQNRTLIRPGQSVGTLVPLDDEKALRDAIVDVVSNVPARTDAARQNRCFITSVADGRVNSRRLAVELEAVLGRACTRH